MNAAAKYFFDLNGYIVVRNVFNNMEVKAANNAIEKHASDAQERTKSSVRNTLPDTPLAGDGVRGRQDLGGLLEWGAESSFFRSVLDHPALVPYFNELLGPGYRMDHLPFAILQNRGSEGFSLHGGTVDCATGEYNPHIAYNCMNGRMHCHLLAVSVALADQRPGDGGYVVVPGSHKANFAAPTEMINGTDYSDFVVQPDIRAGDVLLFSEGTVHGARAWNADHQRRTALYRFAPPTCCYGRSYHPHWPLRMYDTAYTTEDEGSVVVANQHTPGAEPPTGATQLWGLTTTQLAVLEPPYASRVDRPTLVPNINNPGADTDPSGGETGSYSVKVCSRSEEKKLFDRSVFKNKYF